MNQKILAIAVAALASFALPARATNGMRMIGFGPVQNSMGGVGVGATLDSASILTNPAGITELGGRLDFGATYFSPSVEYSAVGINPVGMPPNMFVNQPGLTLKSDRGASPVPAFGLVFPIDESWSFGIGAYGVAGMGVDYAQNLYSGTTFTSYSQMRFTPGVAWKPIPMLSVGLTLNAMWATTEWNAASGFGQAPHDTAGAFGLGATIGAKVTPIEMLTIGVAFETTSFFQDFSYNTAQRPNPMGGAPLPDGVDKLTFNQPCVLTGGVAVRPIDMLLVAADVEWINWPATNGADKPSFSQNSSGAMPWNMNWSGQVVFKIGVQVTPLDWLQVRAGYNYGKSPLDPSRAFENIAFPAVVENHFTAGLGFDVGRHVVINVGGMYAPKATMTGANPDPPQGLSPSPPYGQGIVTYTTAMSQYSLDAGVGYRF